MPASIGITSNKENKFHNFERAVRAVSGSLLVGTQSKQALQIPGVISSGVSYFISQNSYHVASSVKPLSELDLVSYFDTKFSTVLDNSASNRFLRLLETFKKEFNQVKDYYPNYKEEHLRSIFALTASNLLQLDPDKITFEMTYRESLVFTMRFNDYRVYFERYLDTSDGYEFIFSVYKFGKKITTIDGKYSESIDKLRSVVISQPTPYLTNEIPY